jgi:hypothetical protein
LLSRQEKVCRQVVDGAKLVQRSETLGTAAPSAERLQGWTQVTAAGALVSFHGRRRFAGRWLMMRGQCGGRSRLGTAAPSAERLQGGQKRQRDEQLVCFPGRRQSAGRCLMVRGLSSGQFFMGAAALSAGMLQSEKNTQAGVWVMMSEVDWYALPPTCLRPAVQGTGGCFRTSKGAKTR